jgi:hypothetical protein
MAIFDFFLSRNGAAANVAAYTGHVGRLFYDSDDKILRIGNGSPGGERITYPVASSTQIGGIKLGPGVILNQDNQIIIDSEGLDFSFGDFASTTGTYPADYFEPARQNDDYAILSSINANEDIVLASNGTGAIRVVGDFSVRRANGNLASALDEQPIFRVRSDGQVRMLVPSADSAEGAFTIVGGLDAVFQPPVNTGVMLHITGIAGTPGVPSRLYNDAQNAFAAFVARRYNGTAASPTAVLANEEIMRLSGTAHNGNLIPGTANQRIVFKALGNQTLTNAGGAIELWTTAINTTTLAKIATVDSVGITLESGKVLTGNVTGNVSGSAGSVVNALTAGTYLTSGGTYNGSTARTFAVDATTTNTASKVVARDASGDFAAGTITANLTGTASTATNLAAATSILAGTLSVDPPNTGKNGSVIGTYTISGLTTSHKIMIMPQAALPDNFNIGGAWASAANTLSINFQTYAGGIDAAAVTIAYFAWV